MVACPKCGSALTEILSDDDYICRDRDCFCIFIIKGNNYYVKTRPTNRPERWRMT